ncbi:MAG: SMC family ATPase, partial [Candidatus Bathyarchaeia archaeon]
MKILSLYSVNFKKPVLDEPLNLPEGVTLICGPNESGKSTILDAILYALYARVIRPVTMPRNEDLITYGRSRAVVRLDFSIGNRKFRVERRIYLKRPNTASLWEILPEEKLKIMATGQRPVTEEIEKLMGGISFHELVASNVVAQKDLERLIEQGREDRRRVINAFLNLESFNTVLNDLNDERKGLEGTSARPGRLSIEQEKLESLQGKLEEYKGKQKEFEATRQEIQQLEEEMKQVRRDLKETTALYETLESYNKAHEEMKRLSTEAQGKKTLLEELESRLQGFEAVEKDLKETEQRLMEYINLDEAGEALERAKKILDSMARLNVQLQERERRRDAVQSEVLGLEQRLSNLDKDKLLKVAKRGALIWPYVGGAIGCFLASLFLLTINIAPLAVALAILGVIFLTLVGRQISVETKLRVALSDVKRFESLQEELSALKGQINALKNQVLSAEEEIFSLCQGVKRYSGVFMEHRPQEAETVLNTMLSALERDKEDRNRLEERRSNLLTRLGEKPGIAERYQAVLNEVGDLQGALESLSFPALPEGVKFSKELLQMVRERREGLAQDLTRMETLLGEKLRNMEELERFLEEHKDLPRQVEEQRKRVDGLKQQLEVTKISIEAVEKTAEGLRGRVRPSVEHYMGLILPLITNGRYRAVQLDEDYNLKVWDPDAGEFKVKEVFSGGTEDQFLLAMRLAFALALIPEVKGVYPEFLFLDEPL